MLQRWRIRNFTEEIDWDLKSLFEELQKIQSESGIDVNEAMNLKTIQNLSGITGSQF